MQTLIFRTSKLWSWWVTRNLTIISLSLILLCVWVVTDNLTSPRVKTIIFQFKCPAVFVNFISRRAWVGYCMRDQVNNTCVCVKIFGNKINKHSNICVQIQMWWWFDWNLRRVEDRLDANWQSPDFTMGTNVNSAVFGIYYSPSTGPCLLLSTTSQHSLNTKDTILIVSCSTINNVSLIRQEEFYCGEK